MRKKGLALLLAIGPVSYTHIDVYKRQASMIRPFPFRACSAVFPTAVWSRPATTASRFLTRSIPTLSLIHI